MDKKEIENLRSMVDHLDDKIIDLLDQRSSVVTRIGKFKDPSKGVVDESREYNVLKRLTTLSKGEYPKDTIIRIWRELFAASSKLQMESDSNISAKRSIESIKVYKGGKSTIDGIKNSVKLSSNENPFGPSKKISFSSDYKLNFYPEISGITLRNKLSKFFQLESEKITLGCGSDETLLLAALSFCQPGDEIIHAHHGFEMYPIIAKIVGAVSKLAKEENYKVSVQSICDELTSATKLIYIANPNNPTGSYLTKKEIRELLLKVPPNVIVVLDCAYAEYVEQNDYDNDFSLVEEFENVILTRTFSKVYGLAGIRLGWSYSSLKVASILQRVKGPFNINKISQDIAIKALEDQEHVKMSIKENKKNKEWFEDKLTKLHIKFFPSFANFVFIESTIENAKIINESLLGNGIIVRQLNSYNLPQCLRISIGKMEDMKKIVSILEKIK